jgi:transcriptional regulator with XRE-family HTH domain
MIENEPDPLRRIPTKHTVDVRAEVGAVLRAARLKRGQSLEAVAQQTRIPKRYLEALENDRLDEFPAFVYMRGFLKGYCEHLDIPFEELWAKVQPPAAAEAAPAPAATAAGAQAAPAPKPAAPAPAPKPQLTPAPATHVGTAPASSSATGAIVFAAVLAVALGVWVYKDHRPSAAAKPAESTPRALMPLPKTTEPARIGLRAVDDAWVRVTVDDSVAFEGRLPRGAAMEWKPSKYVSLRTTAPASLQLSVNGAPRALANPTPDGEYRIEVP